MIASSVSLRRYRDDRISAPMIGTSPRPGTFDSRFSDVRCNSPAMTKVSPLPSSTVVSARRTVRPGMLKPCNCTPPLLLSWLTSGRTFRLMRLPSITVGVKSRLTPNFLNSMVIIGPPTPGVEAMGTGNSPPARKLAVSPDSAVRLGCASNVMKPSCARASIIELTLPLWTVAMLRLRTSPKVTGFWVTRPKAKRPALAIASQLMPICLRTLRSTSATRTRRLTCAGAASAIRLMIVSPFLVSMKAAAIAIASAAWPALSTVPVRVIDPATASTLIASLGRWRCRASRSDPRLGVMRSLLAYITRPAPSTAYSTVSPIALP